MVWQAPRYTVAIDLEALARGDAQEERRFAHSMKLNSQRVGETALGERMLWVERQTAENHRYKQLPLITNDMYEYGLLAATVLWLGADLAEA